MKPLETAPGPPMAGARREVSLDEVMGGVCRLVRESASKQRPRESKEACVLS